MYPLILYIMYTCFYILKNIFYIKRDISLYIMISLHIELEKADENNNFQRMKELLNTEHREYLLFHLKMTRNIFHWCASSKTGPTAFANIYDLPIETQSEILN
jgi:hypothetical protein